MSSDIDQLHEIEKLSPPNTNKLTNKDRSGDLVSLMLLIEKGMT